MPLVLFILIINAHANARPVPDGMWAAFPLSPWWRHQMETFSALLAICAGNSPISGEFPAQRPVTRSFGVFFDLRLNERLSKHSWGWWLETPSCPLWRQSNAIGITNHMTNLVDSHSVNPDCVMRYCSVYICQGFKYSLFTMSISSRAAFIQTLCFVFSTKSWPLGDCLQIKNVLPSNLLLLLLLLWAFNDML